MEQRLTPGRPARTHDLIRLRDPLALAADEPLPSWVQTEVLRLPWVVVRRVHVSNGLIPIGVRGKARSQRFAARVAATDIIGRFSPEDLAASGHVPSQQRKEAVPALAALERVAGVLMRRGESWGPGGSVGFELATGEAAATALSDLDLILRQDHRLELSEGIALLDALTAAAAPARVDVLLETPSGGVSLADFAAASAQVLVRTPSGPRLSADPWKKG